MNIFEIDPRIAADHLEEHGYPALGEFFREHARHINLGSVGDLDRFGVHGKVRHWPLHSKVYHDLGQLGNPYFTYALTHSDGSYANNLLTLGHKGKGYVSGIIPSKLHDRIVSELTDKTELARRELPEVSDDQFSPVKGLSGAKSNFEINGNQYQTRFDPQSEGHHIFSFEQRNADDEHGITGAGNAMEVFKHVAARFIHGLRTLKPKMVEFSGLEPSRKKLYDRLVAELPKYTDYEGFGGAGNYTVRPKKPMELGRLGDDYPTHPEGYIDEDGNYHANEAGPYGFRHDDTLKRLGYKNTGEANRAGLMHLASPDGAQLLGHRSDRGYTLPQLRKLKTLASEAKLEPAITTTQNGVVSTRSLKLSRDQGDLWPHVNDEKVRGILADVLEEQGDPLHHVLRSPEVPEGPRNPNYRTYWVPMDHPSINSLCVNHYPGKNEHHVFLHSTPHELELPAISGTVNSQQLKEILEHHWAKGNRNNDYYDRKLGNLKLARPGAHGLISPEGIHHPLGMHGLQSHDNLARQLGHKDALDAQAKGFMHVSSDFEHNLIGHNEGRKYHLEQLKTLKQLARDHGYLGAGVTEGNNTRMLKLSRHPLAKGDPRIYADHLEETGYPALAEFYRNHATMNEGDNNRIPFEGKTYSLDMTKPYDSEGHKSLAPITHPDFVGHSRYKYGRNSNTVKLQGAPSDPVAYGSFVSDDLADRIHEELTRPLELARAKAPEGGMVSNNQFYPGGRFLPRALKSIRQVRNRKLSAMVKLSRQNVHDLLYTWRPYEEGDQRHLIAADQLEESDSPAAPLAEFLRNAKPGLPWGYWGFRGMLVPVRLSPTMRRDISPGDRTYLNDQNRHRLATRLKSLEDPESGFHRVYFHHDPVGNLSHIIALMQTGKRAYTWHAPATKEQLQALGAKSKRMKLSSERLWENMAAEPDNPTHRLILADHLEEHGEAPLAEFLRHDKTHLSDKYGVSRPRGYHNYSRNGGGGYNEIGIDPFEHRNIVSADHVQDEDNPFLMLKTKHGLDIFGHPGKELADKIKEHLMSPA